MDRVYIRKLQLDPFDQVCVISNKTYSFDEVRANFPFPNIVKEVIHYKVEYGDNFVSYLTQKDIKSKWFKDSFIYVGDL